MTPRTWGQSARRGAYVAYELGCRSVLALLFGLLVTVVPSMAAAAASTDMSPQAVDQRSAGAEEPDLGDRLRDLLDDPTLSYLLLSLGTLAVVLEVASTGPGGASIVGVLSILLSLFGLSVLPVNALGVALVVLAAVLFVIEVVVPGFGLAGAGGAVALVLGGLVLFDDVAGRDVEVNAAVLVPLGVVAGGSALVAGRLARAVRQTPVHSGVGLLTGQEVVVGRVDGPRVWTFLEGAWWKLRSVGDEPLAPGDVMRVVDVDGLELVVEAAAGYERKVEP